MKLILNIILLSTIALSTITNAATVTSTNPELQSTYQDIQKTLGLVPTFMKAYPESGLSAAWNEMKSVELTSNTVLPKRLKELIGLAVAAQIPCKYCIYFHTESAMLNGASENEIKEAIAMSAATRHWSTYINGIQYNEADLRNEVDKVMSFVKSEMNKPIKEASATPRPQVEPINVMDSQTAYQDIERTLGSVPGFLRMFPENSIADSWKMMKSVQLNPDTELSGKAKELIGLAVAAQIPCKHCTYFHTEAAKVNGASTVEIREAIAMASVTRFWSTELNGSQIDEKTFKKEVNQIMKNARSQEKKRVGMTAITKD